MVTTEQDVTEILAVLTAAGADPRLAGGWGIDALVGRQTREHRDLDVMVLAHRVDAALDRLSALGFVMTTDWRPVRVEVSHERRHVDLHPLHQRADGSGWQSGLDGARLDYPAVAWTRGSIAGQDVPCLTAATQRELRSGYAHREQDRHDLAVIGEL